MRLTKTMIPLRVLGLLIDRLQNSIDNFSNFSGVNLLSKLKFSILKFNHKMKMIDGKKSDCLPSNFAKKFFVIRIDIVA